MYLLLIVLIVALSIIAEYVRRKRRRNHLEMVLSDQRNEIHQAVHHFRELLNSEVYTSKADYPKWITSWTTLKKNILDSIKYNIETEFESELQELKIAFEGGESLIKQKNEEYIQKELASFCDFFDKIESYPLSEEQRRAIIIDEVNSLIIAGAGTGKTSTIIGKTGYLLKKGLAKPDEILLVAFAEKAKKEMEKRAQQKLKLRPRVKTFHSLGLEIIANTENRRPSVSELSIDQLKLQNAILRYIKKRSDDTEFLNRLNHYFAFHRIPYKSQFHFKSMGEYIDYLRKYQIRSLNGDLTKSLEECEIANFLYINGVKYVYEHDYEYNTATKTHRQYKPDFYLPEYKIYIEHFGLDKNNRTAPFIDNEHYLKDVAWKRQIHRKNHTKLVETYSWQKSEGTLIKSLEDNLLSEGIQFRKLPPSQIFDKLNRIGYVHPFTKLIATFLNLFKSTQISEQQLIEKSQGAPDPERCKAFIEIFRKLLPDYQKSLGKEIDFNDMINKAKEYIQKDSYTTKFKYVLVDEFQDISESRFRLLKAISNQNPKTKLCCVGDDWQSIYRFTGSDVSIMTNFNSLCNPSERLFLNETFRFDLNLCDFSTKFILKNPNQIKKQLTSGKKSESPSVTLIWQNDTHDAIAQVMEEIQSLNSNRVSSVFIIGRYNNQCPANLDQLKKQYPKLEITYTTAHSSKGREADYVVIIGLNAHEDYNLGFPSEIADDPILDLVLAKKEPIPNAEERRLFYVALTRAKEHVYLIADKENPSTFITEIERENFNTIIKDRRGETNISCPNCKTGIILLRNGEFGSFYSCSNYPYCNFRPPRCPECGNGFLYIDPDSDRSTKYIKCSDQVCSFERAKCPNCKDGYLVKRSGRYSDFLGCSNFPRCTYTKSFSRRRRRYR